MKQKVKNQRVNKEALLSSVAELSGLSKKDASRALEATMHSIRQSLKNGKDVNLPGFGTFGIYHRPARKGRNPKTGTPLLIAPSKGVIKNNFYKSSKIRRTNGIVPKGLKL